jgi:hypothetical protein
MRMIATVVIAVLLGFSGLACSRNKDLSDKESVQRALDQADLKGISVAED